MLPMRKNNLELVSVLMSTYKEPLEWIELSLNSVINQTYRNIECIIIVDDPSNWELIELLKRYKEKYNFIKLIINEENLGLVRSLNNGLIYCNGQYIARMDADDISHPNRLQEEVAYLKKFDLDVVGCQFESFCDDYINDSRKGPSTSFITNKILRVANCVGHPTWLLKKSVYDSLGGYREINSCEDYDFLLRAAMKGCKIGIVNKPLLRYRHSMQSISSKNKIQQIVISDLLRKNYRQNKVLDYNYYLQWLESDKYKKAFASFEQYIAVKEKILNGHTKKSEKIALFPKLLTCREFYYNVSSTVYRLFWMRMDSFSAR